MSKSAIFVAGAITVTAICVAVIASFGLDLAFGQAMLAGFAALAGLTVIHLAFVKAAPRDDDLFDDRFDGLDRLATELQSRMETIEARLAALDGAAAAHARSAAMPLVEEIAALGGLVTDVAKEVAAHDVEIGKLKTAAEEAAKEAAMSQAAAVRPRPARPPEPDAAQASPPAPAAASAATKPAAASTIAEPDAAVVPAAAPAAAPERRAAATRDPLDLVAAQASRDDLAGRVARALAEQRIEPHLQPIVALPNRRVAYYEALARMAEGDGFVSAADFLPGAIASGRVGEIDRLTLDRASAVAGRLAAHGVSGIFVNLAFATLNDPGSRAALVELFQTRRELTPLIILELARRDFMLLAGEARLTLERLALLGVRLSIEGVANLRLDPRDLARRGVRFVKVPADRLLDAEATRDLAIDPVDLAGLFSRHGVDLIATHVEEERVVPELLDMGLRFAQGRLFGMARPIRSGASVETRAPAVLSEREMRLAPRAAGAR